MLNFRQKYDRVSANRISERGNVLFLILIAVALFAALSYAVTQSSRSGGGDAGSETSLVDSAQVTQYPAAVRTAIIRQIVSKNITASQLEFNSPTNFATCTGSPPAACVFHPLGGGATYAPAPAEVVTTGAPQPWVFNGENEINLVGTTVGGDAPNASTADIIAFLPNVKDSICKKVNTQLSINSGNIPVETHIDVNTQMTNGVGMMSTSNGGTIGDTNAPTLEGHGFGCFKQGGVNYYYHVLIEQ